MVSYPLPLPASVEAEEGADNETTDRFASAFFVCVSSYDVILPYIGDEERSLQR